MIGFLRRLITAPPPEPPLPDGITIDYTRRTWGHDYVIHDVIDGGREVHCSGWGPFLRPRPKRGDYLLLVQGDGSARYQVTRIEYRMDPDDMWAATLRSAPKDPLAKEDS